MSRAFHPVAPSSLLEGHSKEWFIFQNPTQTSQGSRRQVQSHLHLLTGLCPRETFFQTSFKDQQLLDPSPYRPALPPVPSPGAHQAQGGQKLKPPAPATRRKRLQLLRLLHSVGPEGRWPSPGELGSRGGSGLKA